MSTHIRMAAALLLSLMLGLAYAIPMQRPEPDARDARGAARRAAHDELISFLLQAVEDDQQLRGFRVAILAGDGADGFDLQVPRRFLAERGAIVHVICARPAKVLQATGSGAVVKAKTSIDVLNPSEEADSVPIDRFVDQVQAGDYDAVYVPGRRRPAPGSEAAGSGFLSQAAAAGKPIFAIGNGPLLLLEAGLLERRHATGDATTMLALSASNAQATDGPLVRDGMIYTSRDAYDMPALIDALIAALLGQSFR